MPKEQTLLKFKIDDAVRVQRGVVDPDFDDVAISGWAGVIAEQHCNPPMYLVRWNQRTHDHIHPLYRRRCEREDFDNEDMWLAEGDLEPDTGEPPEIEQPAHIATRLLSMDDQDDRIRLALGLTSDDPLPDPAEATLLAYRNYLAANLVLPFDATYSSEPKSYAITVLELLFPDAFPGDEDGLFCNARRDNEQIMLPLIDVEVEGDQPNQRLLDDYSTWFVYG